MKLLTGVCILPGRHVLSVAISLCYRATDEIDYMAAFSASYSMAGYVIGRVAHLKFFTRRRFLAQSGAVTAALSVRPLGAAPGAGQHPIGIQLYSVGEALARDVPGTLSKLREYGYREVETAGFAKLTAREFRKALDAAGLRCVSCHMSFDGEDYGQQFEDAHTVGAVYVASGGLIDFSQVKSGVSAKAVVQALTLEDFKAMCRKANRIGAAAARAGLKFALHNHDFEFKNYGAGPAYDLLLKETDKDLVHFELDCGWASVAGYDAAKYLQAHPRRIRMLHIKDFVREAASGDKAAAHQSTELGRGFIDYKPILAAARHARIEHYFVEQEAPYRTLTPLQAAEANYRYLRARL